MTAKRVCRSTKVRIEGSPIVFPPRTESISQSPKRERLLISYGLSSIDFPRCFLVEGRLVNFLRIRTALGKSMTLISNNP